MFTNRLRRRWIAPLIFALLAVAVLMSMLNLQVRADSTRLILNTPEYAALVSDSGPLDPTPTFIPTITLTPTRTPTSTPTLTRTFEPPFNCSLLSLSNKRLFGNQFRIDIQNDNYQPTFISRVQITWPNIPAFAQTGLTQMLLNSVTMWNGYATQNLSTASTTTDTNTQPGNPPFSSSSTSNRTVAARAANVYAAAFSGPPQLATYVSNNQYAITITMDNPLNPSVPCVLASTIFNPTATPTSAGQPSPTLTPTPDCAAGLITIRFNSFDTFGIVRFDILSQRTTTSTLQGFNINWQKYVNSQRLRQVSLNAPPGQTGAVVVWDSVDVNQDGTPPTNSQVEGTWLTDFTLPPGAVGSPSVTPIYFDFEGIYLYDDFTSSTNPLYGGSSDFNFSEFVLTCGTTGGGQPTSKVTPEVIATPTPRPTFGPTKTLTPSITPASTRTPTLTLTASKTPVPLITATSSLTTTLTQTSTLTRTSTVTRTPTPTRTPAPTPITPTSAPRAAPKPNYYLTHTPTLTWTRVSWAIRYEIQISSDINFPSAGIMSTFVAAPSLSYKTPYLTDGLFYWRVRALDANDNSSGWSKLDSFYIAIVPPPTLGSGN